MKRRREHDGICEIKRLVKMVGKGMGRGAGFRLPQHSVFAREDVEDERLDDTYLYGLRRHLNTVQHRDIFNNQAQAKTEWAEPESMKVPEPLPPPPPPKNAKARPPSAQRTGGRLSTRKDTSATTPTPMPAVSESLRPGKRAKVNMRKASMVEIQTMLPRRQTQLRRCQVLARHLRTHIWAGRASRRLPTSRRVRSSPSLPLSLFPQAFPAPTSRPSSELD